jgi:hypothetical protein
LSRTKLRIPSLVPLAAGLLIAASSVAQAQDTGAAATPVAASASDGAAATHSQGDTQPGAPQSGASHSGTTQTDPGAKPAKPASVCFKLTGHCVQGTKAGASAATKTGSAATKDASSSEKALNLTAPDIRTVVSPDELKEPLPSNEQVTETEESQTVAVKGDQNAPDVPGGFGALWWALNHPSQAWRILAPAE